MKVNRIIASIMAVCVMGCGVPYVNTVPENNSVITAGAVDEADYTEGTYEQLTYKNYGDYIEISDCDESATEVVIPTEIDGVPVTRIGEYAFHDCISLTSVEIPHSVTIIGRFAFYLCNDLKSIEIPDSIISIEAFAFVDCSSLKSIEIPDSITSIGYRAFAGCSSLTSIEIPDSLTNIGGEAFIETLWLEEKQKENPLVVVNNVLIDGKTCMGDIVIPDSVTSIGECAFSDCISLTSVKIPDNVTSIGEYAFSDCSNLISVEIPDSVTSIESDIFSGCSGLTSIEIPDSITNIEYSAFQKCSSLTSIEIPDSVISMQNQAFYRCKSLTSITILNPECYIYDYNSTISNGYNENKGGFYFDGTIYGYENSTAQAYAEKYNRKFVSLGEAPEKDTITGDINGDNKVSIADAVLLQSYILGGQELTEEKFKRADLTGDGFVDSFDMVLLRRMIIENNK
ncbi:MAG: leucine-rich repeat protein [Ruminococcus sp.]|nr:leucine-rich repeat protein [Ruminococcus sp.]